MTKIKKREIQTKIEKNYKYEGEGKRIMDKEFNQIPGRQCRCPNCGYREIYQISVPCYNRKCPRCGSPLTNE